MCLDEVKAKEASESHHPKPLCIGQNLSQPKQQLLMDAILGNPAEEFLPCPQ